MRLLSISTLGDLASAGSVVTIEAGRIFHLYSGRNAWYSTWVVDSYGSFFTTMKEAKEEAEGMRVQGTTFTLTELPAVVARTASATIAISEVYALNPVDVPVPLAGYSATAVIPTHPKKPMIEGSQDNYLVRGVPVQGLVMSFARDSRFWIEGRGHERRHVIAVAIADPSAPIESLGSVDCRQFYSSSQGSEYYLAWSPGLKVISAEAVNRLSAATALEGSIGV